VDGSLYKAVHEMLTVTCSVVCCPTFSELPSPSECVHGYHDSTLCSVTNWQPDAKL